MLHINRSLHHCNAVSLEKYHNGIVSVSSDQNSTVISERLVYLVQSASNSCLLAMRDYSSWSIVIHLSLESMNLIGIHVRPSHLLSITING